MKKVLLGVLMASSFSLGATLGCVDMQKVITTSTKAKQANEEINAKKLEYEKELQNYGKKLEKIQKELQNSALSEAAKQKKIKEFEAIRAKALEAQEKASKDINSFGTDLEKKLNKELREVIASYAKSHNIETVFDCNSLLYKGSVEDITDPVIKEFDSMK